MVGRELRYLPPLTLRIDDEAVARTDDPDEYDSDSAELARRLLECEDRGWCIERLRAAPREPP